MALRDPQNPTTHPSWTLIASALAVLLSAGPLSAQHGDDHGMAMPAATGKLQVVHEPEHQDLVTLIGPIDLPASGNTMRLTPAQVVVVPVDGWVTSFRTRVIDGDGRELPGEILHHINLVRPDRRELFLPVMQRLAAAGQETGRIRVPFPFGVPVSRGDTILVAAMVHNPTGRALQVTIEGRLHYDTPAWLNRMAVQPFYLDVQPPPAKAAFDLPPGRSTASWEGSPGVDVKVLGLGAHLHQYARELRLEQVEPGEEPRVLWRTRPEFRDDGLVKEIPRKTFLLRFGLKLYSDRVYRLVVVYDNPTADTIAGGGMAEIAGVVRSRGVWPGQDPEDPRFMEDYRSFTRNNPALLQLGGAAGPH